MVTMPKPTAAQWEVLRAAASTDHKVWQGTIDRRWYITDLYGANPKVVTASVNVLLGRSLLFKDKARTPYRARLTAAGRALLDTLNKPEGDS